MPTNLSTDEVPICNEPASAEAIDAEEAVWAERFARSGDALEKLAQEAHEDYLAGQDDLFNEGEEPAAEG